MQKLRAISIVTTVVAGLMSVVPSAMADKLEDITSSGKIRIGVLLDAAPWGFKGADGKDTGLDVALAELMAKDLNADLELVPLTGQSRIPSLLADKIDVMIAATGATPERALGGVRLVMLANDVSLRNLIPAELAKGFGFLQSKPRSALSPVFVTPDELGAAWQDSKVHLPLVTHINGKWFGAPEAGVDMQFNFAQLVAHAAKTRPLSAGAIVGSGTIANEDTSLGASCFAEQRTVEALRDGKPSTPFMSFGDVVHIEMLDRDGNSIFGAIEQRIEHAPLP